MAERLELLIPERRIRARVMALGRQIGAEYSGKKLSLVVVLKGACIFAADLMRQIEIPFTIDFITAASYGESARSSGTVVLSGLDRYAERYRNLPSIHRLVFEAGEGGAGKQKPPPKRG